MIHSKNSLLYIMHKFPLLDTIYINDDTEYDKDDVIDSILTTDSNITPGPMAKFVSYVLTISTYDVEIWFKQSILTNFFSEYVKLMPPTTLMHLQIKYYKYNQHPTTFKEENVSMKISNYRREEGYIEDEITGISVRYNHTRHDLPHLQLTETIAASVETLLLSIPEDKLKNINQKVHRNEYKMTTGYCLDHIFQQCTNLQHLYASNLTLIHCNPALSQNKSITLYEATLHKGILIELSVRLLSLKYLKISFNHHRNSDNDENRTNINMPFTTFDTITYEIPYTKLTTSLKVFTELGDICYKFEADQKTKSLKGCFQASMNMKVEYVVCPI